MHLNESYNDPTLQASSAAYQQALYGTQIFQNGTLVPLSAAFVQETTVFREFGPLAGNTMRLAYTFAPNIGGTLSRQTFDGDARYYMRIGTSGVLATRIRAFKSIGDYPDFTYFGGNSEMRGYDYLSFLGSERRVRRRRASLPDHRGGAHADRRRRRRPRRVLRERRRRAGSTTRPPRIRAPAGTVRSSSRATPRRSASRSRATQTDAFGFPVTDPTTGLPVPQYGAPIDRRRDSGCRTARASYGIGLETFALGFPIHFDWSWRTLFNKAWEDVVFASQGGSAAFRKPQFAVWIGYDF